MAWTVKNIFKNQKVHTIFLTQSANSKGGSFGNSSLFASNHARFAHSDIKAASGYPQKAAMRIRKMFLAILRTSFACSSSKFFARGMLLLCLMLRLACHSILVAVSASSRSDSSPSLSASYVADSSPPPNPEGSALGLLLFPRDSIGVLAFRLSDEIACAGELKPDEVES